MNTDQGGQHISLAFNQNLKTSSIRVSMGGIGTWYDKVFAEWLWKLVKYEHDYPHAFESTSEVKSKITGYFDFYYHRRPHSKHDRIIPDQSSINSPPSTKAA